MSGTCLVCGDTGSVRVRLTHWREPVGDRRFENVPRCNDEESCRRRVLSLGDIWPLAESAPKRRVPR